MEKGILADEFATEQDCLGVAFGLCLLDELQSIGVGPGGLGVGFLVPWTDNQTDFVDVGSGCFLEDNFEGGFLGAVLINECLKREGALSRVGEGDEGLAIFISSGLVG